MTGNPIRRYMTGLPQRIAPGQTLADAHQIMRKNRIRHLPVIDRGTLVGIISMGDLHLVETLQDVDPSEVPVEDAMTPRPYAVGPEEPLERVVARMESRKLGSAVVVEGGEVVGVFTTNDALRVLAELLEKKKQQKPQKAQKAQSRRVARAS